VNHARQRSTVHRNGAKCHHVIRTGHNFVLTSKFSVDNPRRVRLIPCMSQPEQKHTTPVSLAVDAVLVAIFFVILFNEVKIHVPSTNSTMITLWSGLTAACMSGVFWLAVQMFRVVLKAQRAANKK